MAYIGSSVIEKLNTQIRPRDEFGCNGYQKDYLLAQEIPGGFESNLLVVIDNVVQEPVTAYTVEHAYRLIISGIQENNVTTVPLAKRTNTGVTAPFELYDLATVFATAGTILLQQVNISTNIVNAEMTIDKIDSSNYTVVGLVNSGSFTPNSTTDYLRFQISGGDYIFITAYAGAVQQASDVPPIGVGADYYVAASASVEVEIPKISDRIVQGAVTGVVANATSSYIDIYKETDGQFQVGAVEYFEPKSVNYADTGTVTYENLKSGDFNIVSIEALSYQLLHLNGIPELNQKIYISHLGGATYQVAPSAGSVTDLALADNLKSFTVDKYLSTSNQTDFLLSKEPVSVQAIIVTINGQVQTDTVDYQLVGGTTLRLSAPLVAGIKVNVIHLGFSTVSRNSFVDGSLTTGTLQDRAVTGAKIALNTIKANNIENAQAITDALGAMPLYTDTFGTQIIQSPIQFDSSSIFLAGGQLKFPGVPIPSTDANTLDSYSEGTFTPNFHIGGSSAGITWTTNEGNYVKIGRMVHVCMTFNATTFGGLTGDVIIDDLPAITNNSAVQCVGTIQMDTGTTRFYSKGIPNSTTCHIVKEDGSLMQHSDLITGQDINVTITYISKT